MSPLSLPAFGKATHKQFSTRGLIYGRSFQIFQYVAEMFLHIQSLHSEIGAE